MNGLLRDLLSERADAAGAPDLDLHDLIAHGERRVIRRRRVVLGGTVAAVVLTVGGSFALVQAGDGTTSPDLPPATDSPSTVDVPPDTTDGARALTYGVGATIHYGDRIIEAAEDVSEIHTFDEGLAFLTGGHGIPGDTRLFYTDGAEPVEIARGMQTVTGGAIGSLLVWLDGDVVIYDVHLRGVIARVPLEEDYLSGLIVLEDAVYWHEYREDTTTTEGRDYLVRYDVSTGIRARISPADYRAAETLLAPRILVVGSANSTEPAQTFRVVDGQLGADVSESEGGEAVFVAATGERLRVSVPDQYNGGVLHMYQWLDDDRFSLVAEAGVKRAPIGDLLVCRISVGQCHTVASAGEESWIGVH